MRVFTITKEQLFLALLFFLASILTFTFYNPSRLVDTKAYQIREAFPPLVFLPGYQQGPPVYASAGVLIESKSGAVLFAKNPDLRRAPASTTKMMTAIVALEKGNLNKIVKVSHLAANTPGSSIWLRAGDKLPLKELLEGMMLQSGNDGSMAVAEGVAGGVEQFVRLMNMKAKEIGALNTNFRNPHGLRAPSHYTTALDLALIARYGLANPRFAALVKQKTAIINWVEKRRNLLVNNTNRLLWYLEGADGVKTGTTSEAGYCLVASATRDGRQLIAVVLNSGDRWGDCARLLEYGFKEFVAIKIATHQRSVASLPVRGGNFSSINLYPRSDLVAVVRKGDQHLVKPQITLLSEFGVAPIRPGRVWGKIGYHYLAKPVEGVDLINLQAVPAKRKWWPW